jgi:acid stress-induced BolA-like protein IbaG/YrbA
MHKPLLVDAVNLELVAADGDG